MTRPCRPRDQAYLEGIARDTWRLFERCVGAEDNHLPPDNLQTVPHDMVAHRTSPTNIGLYLLSVACARQFGWIGTQELIARMEATLATLATLRRHRGHFLNWYDTQTCAPLLPMYVSTVDSGNLRGHLLAVAQACLELARAPHDAGASQRAIEASRQRLESAACARARGVAGRRRAGTPAGDARPAGFMPSRCRAVRAVVARGCRRTGRALRRTRRSSRLPLRRRRATSSPGAWPITWRRCAPPRWTCRPQRRCRTRRRTRRCGDCTRWPATASSWPRPATSASCTTASGTCSTSAIGSPSSSSTRASTICSHRSRA